MPQPSSHPDAVLSADSNPDSGSVLLGPSAAMAHLWSQLRRLAPHARCILLTGEADCGQEAVARSLLQLSAQRSRPFLILPPAQAEAALMRSSGLTSMPLDGFLYLPNVQHLSLAAQAGILGLMRLRRSRPFTVVASTGEDLRALASVGRFLPELADALAAVRLAIPALRERREDLPLLLTHMLTSASTRDLRPAPVFDKGFLEAALQHTWPGNLRELARVVASLGKTTAHKLGAPDLAASLSVPKAAPELPAPASTVPVRMVSLDTVVQEHIFSVLRGCRGNKLRAAEILGISRSTLYRMLEANLASTTSVGPMHQPFC